MYRIFRKSSEKTICSTTKSPKVILLFATSISFMRWEFQIILSIPSQETIISIPRTTYYLGPHCLPLQPNVDTNHRHVSSWDKWSPFHVRVRRQSQRTKKLKEKSAQTTNLSCILCRPVLNSRWRWLQGHIAWIENEGWVCGQWPC